MTTQPLSNKVSRPTCVYCGRASKITREHVFPKNLFLPPRPKNLVTVPACEPCNRSYSDDDEYFRIYIVVPAFDNPIGRQMWDQKIMRSTLKRRPKLGNELVASMKKVELKSPAGIILGTAEAVLLNRERIDRVFKKIVCGLYFHHVGYRLPSDSSFRIYPHLNINGPEAVEFVAIIKQAALQTIGDGSVVQYRYAYAPELPEVSLWILCFFRAITVAIFTNAPGSRGRAASGGQELAVELEPPQFSHSSGTRPSLFSRLIAVTP
jgi:hypothetical protein